MLGNFIRSHKITTTIIILALLGFIAISLYTLIPRIGKEPVTIYLIPNDATLSIDGQQFKPGMAYLKPGTYSVKAEKEGFRTYEDTIKIEAPNTTDIDIALAPESDEAKQWQQDNMNQYYEFERRTGVRAIEFGQQFQERFPITAHLPFKNYIYSIGHRLKNLDNPSEGVIIEITAITGYREAALDKIREFGFDPTDYEINFNNYENPFSHE